MFQRKTFTVIKIVIVEKCWGFAMAYKLRIIINLRIVSHQFLSIIFCSMDRNFNFWLIKRHLLIYWLRYWLLFHLEQFQMILSENPGRCSIYFEINFQFPTFSIPCIWQMGAQLPEWPNFVVKIQSILKNWALCLRYDRLIFHVWIEFAHMREQWAKRRLHI